MKKLLISLMCVASLGLSITAQAKVTYYPAVNQATVQEEDDDDKVAMLPIASGSTAAIAGISTAAMAGTAAIPAAVVAAQGAILGLAPLTVVGTIALGSAVAVGSENNSGTTGTH